MDVRIFRPSKTATQSGRRNTKRWVLEYEACGKSRVEDLMGWTGTDDMAAQVKLTFDSEEAAVSYADRCGLTYVIVGPETRRVRPKSYADNFIRKT